MFEYVPGKSTWSSDFKLAMMAGGHMLRRTLKGRFDMKPTRKHLVGVAAALSTIAIAAPVSTAGAATAPPAVAPGTWVIGPTFITTAPATFINTNTQVSTGDNLQGDEIAP
jgi:hypothetical protein